MGILRLLLALLVVNGHTYTFSYKSPLGGEDALHVFFAISGFYMALVLSRKYTQKRDFYINRYLRLYPSYFVVLVSSVAFFGMIVWHTHQLPPPFWIYQADRQMATWQWLLLQLSNLTMIGQDIPSLFHWSAQKGFLFFHYSPGDTAPDGAEWCGWFPWIRQAWSIGAELWFYLLAPFLVRRPLAFQIGVITVSLAIKLAMERHGFTSYYFFPANLWLFMTGSVLFACYPVVADRGRRVAIPIVIGIVVICLFGDLIENGVLHWLLLCLIIAAVPALFARFSTSRWDNAIGELSYPVYLIHLLVIAILKTVLHVTNPLAAIAGSLVLGVAMVRFVENPVNRYRQWRHQRAETEKIRVAEA